MNRALNYCFIGLIVLQILTIVIFFMFTRSVRTYKPDFKPLEVALKHQVGIATTDFLTNNVLPVLERENSQSSTPQLLCHNFTVQGSPRDIVLSDGVSYGVGDYINVDGQLVNILGIDFERQRFYGILTNSNACVVIPAPAELSAPSSRARARAAGTESQPEAE